MRTLAKALLAERASKGLVLLAQLQVSLLNSLATWQVVMLHAANDWQFSNIVNLVMKPYK